jgi:hypothetical protein
MPARAKLTLLILVEAQPEFIGVKYLLALLRLNISADCFLAAVAHGSVIIASAFLHINDQLENAI